MKKQVIPKSIQKWIDKNKEKVQDAFMEDNGCPYDACGEYDVWVYLKSGFRVKDYNEHSIHEFTVADFMYKAKLIEKCPTGCDCGWDK